MRPAEPRQLQSAALVVVLLLGAPARASAQPTLASTTVAALGAEESQEQRRRRELHDLLGIKNPPRKPEHRFEDIPDGGMGPEPPPPSRQRLLTYVSDARPVLERTCGGCHRSGGQGGTSRWVLASDVRADHEATRQFVSLSNPEQSELLKKGSGATVHSGGRVIAPSSPEYSTLLRWIEGGARLGAAPTGSPGPEVPRDEIGRSPIESSETPKVESLNPSSNPVEDVPFAPRVHEALLAGCSGCHGAGKLASARSTRRARILLSTSRPPARWSWRVQPRTACSTNAREGKVTRQVRYGRRPVPSWRCSRRGLRVARSVASRKRPPSGAQKILSRLPKRPLRLPMPRQGRMALPNRARRAGFRSGPTHS